MYLQLWGAKVLYTSARPGQAAHYYYIQTDALQVVAIYGLGS